MVVDIYSGGELLIYFYVFLDKNYVVFGYLVSLFLMCKWDIFDNLDENDVEFMCGVFELYIVVIILLLWWVDIFRILSNLNCDVIVFIIGWF